jgi:mRNA interferase MazF
MQEAMKDDLFVADLREVMEDFSHVDAEETPMTLERWSVWLANLDPVVGSEQGRTRPVLVLSDTTLNHILPLLMCSQLLHGSGSGVSIRTNHGFLLGPPDLMLNQLFSATRFAPSTNSG